MIFFAFSGIMPSSPNANKIDSGRSPAVATIALPCDVVANSPPTSTFRFEMETGGKRKKNRNQRTGFFGVLLLSFETHLVSSAARHSYASPG